MMERVYIGLGSNLAKPLQQLRAALQAIAQLPHSQLQAHSSFYLSDPLGPADQPRYVNAVAALGPDATQEVFSNRNKDFSTANYCMVRTVCKPGDARNKEWRPRGLATPAADFR